MLVGFINVTVINDQIGWAPACQSWNSYSTCKVGTNYVQVVYPVFCILHESGQQQTMALWLVESAFASPSGSLKKPNRRSILLSLLVPAPSEEMAAGDWGLTNATTSTRALSPAVPLFWPFSRRAPCCGAGAISPSASPQRPPQRCMGAVTCREAHLCLQARLGSLCLAAFVFSLCPMPAVPRPGRPCSTRIRGTCAPWAICILQVPAARCQAQSMFPCPEQPMPARKTKNDDEQILRAVAVSIYINDWLRRVNDTRRPFLRSRSRPCRVVTANANTAGEDAQHQMTSERDCFSPVEYWRPWLGGSLARGNSHINGHPQPAAGTGRHCVPLAFI